jgi:hypothetical protein
MKKVNFLLLAAWAACFSVSALASGGSVVGNPTDNFPLDHDSAWFLGPQREIKVCYRLSPRFGAAPGQVEEAIRSAFRTWHEYMDERQVSQLFVQQYPGMGFAFRFRLHSHCDGREDLRFELGSTGPEVEAQKARLLKPMAFAQRETYDAKAGWGRGFIWIAPEGSVEPSSGFPRWAESGLLAKIVLHELGHVYGCPHVRGTIMDEYLSRDLLEKRKVATQIDQRNQVAFCWRCTDTIYRGRLGYANGGVEDSERAVFQAFLGRQAVGSVTAELHMSPAVFFLRVTDDSGSKDLPISFPGLIHTGFDRGERIFRAVWTGPGGEEKLFDFFNGGRVAYGGITNARGELVNLVFELNSHSLDSPGPYTLRWLEGGRAHQLFY